MTVFRIFEYYIYYIAIYIPTYVLCESKFYDLMQINCVTHVDDKECRENILPLPK